MWTECLLFGESKSIESSSVCRYMERSLYWCFEVFRPKGQNTSFQCPNLNKWKIKKKVESFGQTTYIYIHTSYIKAERSESKSIKKVAYEPYWRRHVKCMALKSTQRTRPNCFFRLCIWKSPFAILLSDFLLDVGKMFASTVFFFSRLFLLSPAIHISLLAYSFLRTWPIFFSVRFSRCWEGFWHKDKACKWFDSTENGTHKKNRIPSTSERKMSSSLIQCKCRDRGVTAL